MAVRPFTWRRQVKLYDINDSDFLKPGDLLESVLHQVVKEGVFLGRLLTWSTDDALRNVRFIKDALNNDSEMSLFHPDWLKRMPILDRSAIIISPYHSETVQNLEKGKLRRMQRRMHKDIANFQFVNVEEKSTLEQSLDISLDLFLDNVLSKLDDKSIDVLYVQNIDLPEHLDTTPDVSVCKMQHNLEKLNGGKIFGGINSPTVYVSSELATFNAHREDMSFCTFNRHIAGNPKVWFCVPPSFYTAFTDLLSTLPIQPTLKELKCYLQHKMIWLDPRLVTRAGIPVSCIVQEPGDIVYLHPNTIHWGVSTGMCISEAINFVSSSWLMPGMLANQRCSCNPEWNFTFEISETLQNLGADKDDYQAWKCGHTSDISMKLKREIPLLHPNTSVAGKDDETENFLKSGNEPSNEEVVPTSSSAADKVVPGKGYPRCLLCPSYCPRKYNEEGFKRIRKHALKHHSLAVDGMMKQVRAMWSREERKKNFKVFNLSVICAVQSYMGRDKTFRTIKRPKNVKFKSNIFGW